METRSLQLIGNLSVGDRYYKPKDKQRAVYELMFFTSTHGWECKTELVDSCRMKDKEVPATFITSVKRDTQVIYLRSTINNEAHQEVL